MDFPLYSQGEFDESLFINGQIRFAEFFNGVSNFHGVHNYFPELSVCGGFAPVRRAQIKTGSFLYPCTEIIQLVKEPHHVENVKVKDSLVQADLEV